MNEFRKCSSTKDTMFKLQKSCENTLLTCQHFHALAQNEFEACKKRLTAATQDLSEFQIEEEQNNSLVLYKNCQADFKAANETHVSEIQQHNLTINSVTQELSICQEVLGTTKDECSAFFNLTLHGRCEEIRNDCYGNGVEWIVFLFSIIGGLFIAFITLGAFTLRVLHSMLHTFQSNIHAIYKKSYINNLFVFSEANMKSIKAAAVGIEIQETRV